MTLLEILVIAFLILLSFCGVIHYTGVYPIDYMTEFEAWLKLERQPTNGMWLSVMLLLIFGRK